MKLKMIITTALVIGLVTFSFAQKGKEEQKAKRIAFITSRLELTPDESKAFWPIFEQRNDEIRETIKPLRKANRKGKKHVEEMSDDEVKSLLENIFKIRQLELDIQKKYHNKLLKVLPPRKLAKLYHIEKRFKQERRGKQGKQGEKRHSLKPMKK